MRILLCIFLGLLINGCSSSSDLPNARPPVSQRTLSSSKIESIISGLAPYWKTKNLATLFANCLPNTLDTTVQIVTSSPPDAFVITGDIDALWLRDSQNQVMPYLPYAPEDTVLQSLIIGLIARHANSVMIDSFANR